MMADSNLPCRVRSRSVCRFRVASPMHATLQPMLCLVAQGAKTITLGHQVFDEQRQPNADFLGGPPGLRPGSPAQLHPNPTCASGSTSIRFRIAELALRVFPSGVPKPENPLGLYLGDVQEEIVDAATRLVALMSQPEEARLLGPLLIDEILIRLLRSPVGAPSGSDRMRRFQAAASRQGRRRHSREFPAAAQDQRARADGPHEPVVVPPALQGRHRHESASVPEGAAA